MITKKIQIYTNRITTDIQPYLTAMFQYYLKHGVTLNYDIIAVNVTGYQSVKVNVPLVGDVYVLQGAESLVPLTSDHDIHMFIFDYSDWKAPWYWPWPLWGNVPRDDTYSVAGKPFINIGVYATDITVGQRFIHEPMHALAKIFGCTDVMDTYLLDSTPDAPGGNFAQQWAIFQPYLTKMPTIQQSTLNLVESFEGFEASPYRDSAGVWTIGIGFTHLDGAPVTEATLPMTREQADTELKSQLQHYADTVTSSVKVQLNQNQFDACCSLCYNIGTGGFASSTVCKDLNANNFQGAADAFLLWNRAGGQMSPILADRRQKERTLFLT